MTSRPRHAAVVALIAGATLAAGCSSDSNTPSDPKKPSTHQQVTHTARSYLHAWMAVKPADAKTMCSLESKASRPNFDDDGGTLSGCVKERADIGAQDNDTSRAPLEIKISHMQAMPATDRHPAGKGVLATLHRAGEDRFRYALRLVPEAKSWRVNQANDVSDRYDHTADPVAPVLTERQ